VKLVFQHIGHDDGQFGHLMTQRLGIMARQGTAATTTGAWLARDRLPHLLGRDQQSQLQAMPWLAAGFLAGLVNRPWRGTFAVKAVRRRRQRGIGRIGAQWSLGMSQLLLDLLEDAFEVVDFGLELAVGRFQFLDTLLGIGGF
jgi:hypothetical protein